MNIGNMVRNIKVCRCNSKRYINVEKTYYDKRLFSNSGHIITDMQKSIFVLVITINMVYNWQSNAIQRVIFAWRTT